MSTQLSPFFPCLSLFLVTTGIWHRFRCFGHTVPSLGNDVCSTYTYTNKHTLKIEDTQ